MMFIQYHIPYAVAFEGFRALGGELKDFNHFAVIEILSRGFVQLF
jgi:hypothetical protein